MLENIAIWEVVKLRLMIKMTGENFSVPVAYRHLIQGLIYNMLYKDEIGEFYHNHGYKKDSKMFKMFVFSDLFGKYRYENKRLYYENDFYFYISSIDDAFIEEIYNFISVNKVLVIDKQIVHIKKINIINMPSIKNNEKILLKTLSPITAYKKVENKTIYYSPNDNEFNELIINNLHNKVSAYNYPINDLKIEIIQYRNVTEKMISYKNCNYLSYYLTMECKLSSDVFAFFYNAGISAKGSCGFGMINLVNEKNSLFV